MPNRRKTVSSNSIRKSDYEAFKINEYLQRQRRESLSSVDEICSSQFSDSSYMLFNTLLKDPDKRAKVFELLTKEGLVAPTGSAQSSKSGKKKGNLVKVLSQESSDSPLNNLKQKIRYESPSSILRRRELEQLHAREKENKQPTKSEEEVVSAPRLPSNEILKGVVAFCEVRSGDEDRSDLIKRAMLAMGAVVLDKLNSRSITHVVFRDGSYRTYERAKLLGAKLVSVLWLEACRKNASRVAEGKYPALGARAPDYNLTSVCGQFEESGPNAHLDFSSRISISSTSSMSEESGVVPASQMSDDRFSSLSRANITDDLSPRRSNDLASHIKDSFELKTAQSVRSPESLAARRISTSPEDDDESFELQVTNDESKNGSSNEISKSKLSPKEKIPLKKARRTLYNPKNVDSTNSNDPKSSNEFRRSKRSSSGSLKDSKSSPEDSIHLHVSSEGSKNHSSKKSEESLGNKKSRSMDSKTSPEDSIHLHVSSEGSKNGSSKKSEESLENEKSRSKNSKTSPEDSIHLHVSSDVSKSYSSKKSEDSSSDTISFGQKRELTKRRRTLYDIKIDQFFDVDTSRNKPKEVSTTKASFVSIEESGIHQGQKTSSETRKSRRTLYRTANDLSDIDDSERSSSGSLSVRQTKSLTETESSKVIKEISSKTPPEQKRNTSKRNNKIEKPKKKSKSATKLSVLDNSPQKQRYVTEIKKNTTVDVSKSNENEDVNDIRKYVCDSFELKNAKKISTPINEVQQERHEKDKSIVLHVTSDASKSRNSAEISVVPDLPKQSKRRKLYNPITDDLEDRNFRWSQEPKQPELPKFKTKYVVEVPGNINTPKQLTRKAQIHIGKKETKTSSSTDNKSSTKKNKNTKLINKTSLKNRNEEVITDRRKSLRNVRMKLYDTPKDKNSCCSSEEFHSAEKSKKNDKKIEENQKKNSRTKKESVTKKNTEQKLENSEQKKIFKENENINDRRKSLRNVKAKIYFRSPEKKSPPNKNTVSKTPTLKPQTPKTNKKQTIKNTQTSQKTNLINIDNSEINGSRIIDKLMLKEVNERRSTFEFEDLNRKPKTQLKKEKYGTIVCTRLHRDQNEVFAAIVRRLPGFTTHEDEVTKNTTHLVAGDAGRTINLLRAIARGCWVLRHEWLLRSAEAGKWLPEEEFELTEFSPTVRVSRSEREIIGKNYHMNILNAKNVWITPSSTPRRSDLQELVKLTGGLIASSPKKADLVLGERMPAPICVSETWLLECITSYKYLPYERYVLAPTSE